MRLQLKYGILGVQHRVLAAQLAQHSLAGIHARAQPVVCGAHTPVGQM